MFYLTNTPKIFRQLLPASLVWEGKLEAGNEVYLSFDDGPHPEITTWVLDLLAAFNMQASFFCIGKNAVAHPHIIQRIKSGSHTVGNHTFSHVNAIHTSKDIYLDEVGTAINATSAFLFRPPYGRITRSHLQAIESRYPEMKCIMWNVLSGDFDVKRTGESCYQSVRKHTKPGSIIVFHDSEKAWPRLKKALPATLQWLQAKRLRSVAL